MIRRDGEAHNSGHSAGPAEVHHVAHRIATVAWLAIALGLTVQILVLAAQLVGGATFSGPRFLAAVTQGVSWSVIVCIGIAAGTILMRASVTFAGVIGFVCAPVALGVARGTQRGVSELLGLPAEGITTTLVAVAALKALQYGFLGLMLARLVQHGTERLRPYVVLGVATAATFGGVIVVVTAMIARSAGTPVTTSGLAGLMVNELVFPLGCVLVVFTVQTVARLQPRPPGGS